MPLITFAQGKDLKYLIGIAIEYFNYAIQLTIALAVVMFIWNVYKYLISKASEPDARKEAGQYILWSIVGFFVILSIWGLVNILLNSFKLDNGAPNGFFPKFNSGGSTSNSPSSESSLFDRPSNGSGVTNGGSNGSGTTNGGSNGSGTTNGGTNGSGTTNGGNNGGDVFQQLGPQ